MPPKDNISWLFSSSIKNSSQVNNLCKLQLPRLNVKPPEYREIERVLYNVLLVWITFVEDVEYLEGNYGFFLRET